MSLLIIDLITDYIPGDDFNYAEVMVVRQSDSRVGRLSNHAVSAADDFTAGVRIGEVDDIDERHYVVLTKLLDSRGRTVDFKKIIHDMPGRNDSIRVAIARGQLISQEREDPYSPSAILWSSVVELARSSMHPPDKAT